MAEGIMTVDTLRCLRSLDRLDRTRSRRRDAMKLTHTSITTGDVGRLRSFYREVLQIEP